MAEVAHTISRGILCKRQQRRYPEGDIDAPGATGPAHLVDDEPALGHTLAASGQHRRAQSSAALELALARLPPSHRSFPTIAAGDRVMLL